jgi:hypothetical protein
MNNQILTFLKLIVIRPDAISHAPIAALAISWLQWVQRLYAFNMMVILVGDTSALTFRALFSDIYLYHNADSASYGSAHCQHGCIVRGFLFEANILVLRMIDLKLYESETLTAGYLKFGGRCCDIGSCGLTE